VGVNGFVSRVPKTIRKVTQIGQKINFEFGSGLAILSLYMKNKTTLIVIAIIIVAVIAAAIIASRGSSTGSGTSGKYQTFSECLKTKGLQFWGAFWCPHCQAQEAEFQMSRQSLEDEGLYNECSTPDGSGQLPACKAKGVESYPTWFFPTPIVFTAATAPTICPTADKLTADSPAICKTAGSARYETWIFAPDTVSPEGLEVQSTTTPTVNGTTWTFDPTTSHTAGGLSLQFLSNQSSCPLPQ
jgi:hypothetical protein